MAAAQLMVLGTKGGLPPEHGLLGRTGDYPWGGGGSAELVDGHFDTKIGHK